MFCSYRRFVYNFSYGIGSIRKNVDPWTQNPSDPLLQCSNSSWNIFRLVDCIIFEKKPVIEVNFVNDGQLAIF